MNIYKQILERNIPRLLGLYNADPVSLTRGVGDRLYWGWKVSDFANGTMQGGCHALAIAVKWKLVENEDFAVRTIRQAIEAVERVRSRNGSLAEAYPSESSFCVTALAAFDVLSAVDHLRERFSDEEKQKYYSLVGPLVDFITRHVEDHAVISNHLAAAAAAVVLWNRLTGDRKEYQGFLNAIARHQSGEGWYREYEGADPGYQTLCSYYLAVVQREINDPQLGESLERSAQFLEYFVHPDGTLGGLYGSRNTEVYYPAGLLMLAEQNPAFAAMARHLEKGIREGRHILPENIDSGNYVPLLNAYAVAADQWEQKKISSAHHPLPCENKLEQNFKEAGIFIKSSAEYYAIVNYKKGGTLKVFDRKTGRIDLEDGGLFGELKNGQKFSAQAYDGSISFDQRRIKCGFYLVNECYPTPFQFMVLRFLSSTFFQSSLIHRAFKRAVVRKLMTGKQRIDGGAVREFQFSDGKIRVKEAVTPPQQSQSVGHPGKSTAIHMASSGYYSKQMLEQPQVSRIVEFQ